MPLPDVLGAFLVQTRLKIATFTLCGGRISAGRPRTQDPNDPSGWAMPTYAVVYLMVPGPAIPRQGRVPWKSGNIQVECYGPDLRTAGDLYRVWYADFYPTDIATASGFVSAGCSIASLEELSTPVALFGGENIWPKVVSTHLIRYCEVSSS